MILDKMDAADKPQMIDSLAAQRGALRHVLRTADDDAMAHLKRTVTPDHFQDAHCRAVAVALWTCYEAREPFDFEAIGKYLQEGLELEAFTAMFEEVMPTPQGGAHRLVDCAHTVLNWKRAASTCSTRKIVIFDAAAVLEMPPMVPIIEDFLFKDTLAEIVGGYSSFKSFQALGIAEAVAGGHEWQGRKTKQMPTLCVTPEGAAGLRKRVKALQIARQRPCRARFILQAVQIHRPDEVDALLEAIAELPESPGLIIIDTLARCFVGGDENSARDAGLFIAGLDRIRGATGATVLVVHHIGKSGEARGSTALPGAFDTIIEAKRQDTIITLKNSKQKDDGESAPLSLVQRIVELGETDAMGREITSLVFDPTDAPPVEAPEGADATREKVLQVLAGMPNGARATTWQLECARLKITGRSRFFTLRDELVQSGKVIKANDVYNVASPISPIKSNSDGLDAKKQVQSVQQPVGLDGLDLMAGLGKVGNEWPVYGND